MKTLYHPDPALRAVSMRVCAFDLLDMFERRRIEKYL